MAYMKLRVKKREHVLVELWNEDKPLGHILLGPSEAESHCQLVAKNRANLTDEVSRELDPNSRLQAIYDPIWRSPEKHSHDAHGVALALRHPGLGWLTFLLPYKEAEGLGRWLMDHSKPPSSESKTPSSSC